MFLPPTFSNGSGSLITEAPFVAEMDMGALRRYVPQLRK